jgi:hypothetical protein
MLGRFFAPSVHPDRDTRIGQRGAPRRAVQSMISQTSAPHILARISASTMPEPVVSP